MGLAIVAGIVALAPPHAHAPRELAPMFVPRDRRDPCGRVPRNFLRHLLARIDPPNFSLEFADQFSCGKTQRERPVNVNETARRIDNPPRFPPTPGPVLFSS